MFLFYQSSGHTKLCEYGLVCSNMSGLYGGGSSQIPDAAIKEPGPCQTDLSVIF